MYYTFLPYAEQQKMKREYRVRVWIVSLFLLSVAGIIGVGSLFPAYMYSSFEERSHLNQVAAFKKTADASSITSIQKELSASSGLISSLSDSTQPDVFSSALSAIATISDEAHGAIKINSFDIDRSSSSTMTVTISGIAANRESLLAFKSRLEGLSGKTTVNLPFSDLAQDKDAAFSIAIQETLP